MKAEEKKSDTSNEMESQSETETQRCRSIENDTILRLDLLSILFKHGHLNDICILYRRYNSFLFSISFHVQFFVVVVRVCKYSVNGFETQSEIHHIYRTYSMICRSINQKLKRENNNNKE